MGAHLSTNVAEGRAFMQIVDGKPVDSLSGERIEVVCPSDGKAFASIPMDAPDAARGCKLGRTAARRRNAALAPDVVHRMYQAEVPQPEFATCVGHKELDAPPAAP